MFYCSIHIIASSASNIKIHVLTAFVAEIELFSSQSYILKRILKFDDKSLNVVYVVYDTDGLYLYR